MNELIAVRMRVKEKGSSRPDFLQHLGRADYSLGLP
jgi:hypothetical protein